MSGERYINDIIADLTVVRVLLNENRPLEALNHANHSLEKYKEEKDG